MDEFEMRPITEGLGFHRKKQGAKLKDSISESGAIDDVLSRSLPEPPPDDLLDTEVQKATSTLDELLASLETKTPIGEREMKVHNPLPRTGEPADLMAEPATEPLSEPQIDQAPTIDPMPAPERPITERPFQRPVPKVETRIRRSGHDAPPVSLLQPTTTSISSSLLDGIVVLGLSLMFLVPLLVVTEVSLDSILRNAGTEATVQISLALLYVAVLQMYVVVSRSFFGRTLAEWTFEMQLGNDQQIQRASYPFLVLWRSLVITLTGVIVLPLLSFIFRRDLCAPMTGLQLYKKKLG